MPHKDPEQRRAYNRMRYAERMANDPEWAEKHKKQQAESYQRRKKENPDFVERRKEQFKRWYEFRGKESAQQRKGYMPREEWLKACEANRKERRKEYRRKRGSRHTLTPVEYDNMYEAQEGCCAICGMHAEKWGGSSPRESLAVDHCHNTGVVRGLLCCHCNWAIGHFRDDPQLMRIAADYVEGFIAR